MTSRAARALLAGIVDYAGLFPPARLPLEEAARTYARHRASPSSWMLARFILPAGRLDEFGPHHGHIHEAGGPYELSLLAGGGTDRDAFLDALRRGMERAAAFEREIDGEVRVGALELRLPDAPNDASALAAASTAIVDEVLGRGVPMFLEAPPGEAFEARLAEAAHAAAAASEASGIPVGLKLRCGGLEPAAFPTATLVTRALVGCRDLGIPFKATAGLHHPVRGTPGPGGVVMHGFLNVFGGGVLAHDHGLDAAALLPIVEEADADAFRLDGDEFAWRRLSTGADRIADVRRTQLVSFGSCSFDEPLDDLARLGFLQEANR